MKNHISMKKFGTALVIIMLFITFFFSGRVTARQTHMQNALDALRTARNELNLASPGKGGHRAKALDLVNQAIGEVKLGIKYAQ